MSGVWSALVTSLSNVLRPKNTEPLPWNGDRKRAPRYRATFALVHERPQSDEERQLFREADTRLVGGEPKTREEMGMSEDEWAEFGEEACIGCKMCEKICPSDVISVAPGGRKASPIQPPDAKKPKKRGYCADFTLDLNACIVCELCVQVCPTDAIIMLKVPEPPGFSREDLLLTMDKLYANEELNEPYWADGTALVEMQDPKRGLD